MLARPLCVLVVVESTRAIPDVVLEALRFGLGFGFAGASLALALAPRCVVGVFCVHVLGQAVFKIYATTIDNNHCVFPFKEVLCVLAVVYLFSFKVFHHASATRFSMGRLSSLAFHAFQRALRASHFRVVASLVFSACSWLVIVLPFVVLLFLILLLYLYYRHKATPNAT